MSLIARYKNKNPPGDYLPPQTVLRVQEKEKVKENKKRENHQEGRDGGIVKSKEKRRNSTTGSLEKALPSLGRRSKLGD